MDLLGWSRRPARDVASTSTPASVARGLVARATTPLLPDDYLHLINPLWSARELRGRVVSVARETDDTATVTIATGWGFAHDYRPGQYVGIGVDVGGRWHWRSYSLTSIGHPRRKQISITVKANRDGFLSSHLVDGLDEGTVIRLAAPQGDFVLPQDLPPKILFVTGGSGITPVMAMLRSLAASESSPDIVHLHLSPTADDVIFADELRALDHGDRRYRLDLRLTREGGHVDLRDLSAITADWRSRETWACGPARMLDDITATFTDAGLTEHLHVERFSVDRTGASERGGTITFAKSGRTVTADGATTVLEAGESLGVAMPFGCRMGICQSCVAPLVSGHVRDLRSGTEHREGERIQTCISAAAGDCTVDL